MPSVDFICHRMITHLYSLLMHHIYVYYTFLVFGVTDNNTPTLIEEIEAVEETPPRISRMDS